MRRFYEAVVRKRKLILVIYILLCIVSIICKPFVGVDYDMNDYLPADSPSTTALDEMNAEFSGGVPNARVMIENVTVPEALEYKAKLEAVDGVSEVLWLDDAESVEIPLEMMDSETVDTYYKDHTALFTLTIEEDKRVEAVQQIRNLIGDENAMSGSAVSTAAATTSTVSEISKIAMFGVLFVFVVLILTTDNWASPLLVMAGLGVAILINAGSNIIFGTISFVTNAAGNILQLAVSLDYSVFLLHRFMECRKEKDDEKEAMVDALVMSTSSILSSGLTTVIGFLALCLMQFRIGPDLGLALAKGIAISLITVFTFMPSLILMVSKWMKHMQHRSFVPSFGRFGNVVQKIMIPMAILFFVMIVPSYLASNANSFYYGSSRIFNEQTQTGADKAKIESRFGKSDTYVLMVPLGDKAKQKILSDKLHELTEVTGIISYVDSVGMEIPEEYLDSLTLHKLNSDKMARMVLTVNAAYEGEETFELVEKIRCAAEEYYPGQWYLAGEGVSTYDLMDTVTQDMLLVNLVAIGAVFLVLLVTMKSVMLPVILVLAIETAIWINLSIPYFQGQKIFYIAYLIISSVQLGATVDYAILMTDRYKELREVYHPSEAVKHTIEAVTVSILTSGSVLTVIGFLLGMISTHGLLSQLGYFLGKGTLCSLFIVLFVLPGLLFMFDKTFIRSGRKEKDRRKVWTKGGKNNEI